eukprot:GHVL01035263.1.p1 GENE.GHVL01035263.1~~GHVL01035263.1.p1  ORF type:complete len:124 (+),score=31.61 GHVL01035263.1:36-407(+)
MDNSVLIIHFDINSLRVNTNDSDSDEYSLLTLFASHSWGTVNPETLEWECSNPGGVDRPDSQAISYLEWLHNRYPIEDNINNENIFKKKLLNFANKRNGPNGDLKPFRDKLLKSAKIPNSEKK